MQKASNKAYISGRKLEKYQQERERMQKEQRQLAVIEERMDDAGTLMEIKSEMLLQDIDGDAVMKSEEKKMGASMISKSKKAQAREEEDEDEDSAEDLDSDDLEDEIKDNMGDMLQFQIQQEQMMAPPQMASSSIFGGMAPP